MERTYVIAGALFAFLAVGAGAFGAHALADRLDARQLDTFEIAARYQMYHALALFAVAWAMTRYPDAAVLAWPGRFFIAGIVIFAGTLYGIAFGGPRWLGAITPIGGVLFLIGWATLAWGVWRTPA